MKRYGNRGIKQYEDMIYLPRHISEKHPPMPQSARAAQFGAFRALTGHEDAICETARLTETRPELDENAQVEIDRQLQLLLEKADEQPVFIVTYFVPDAKKAGGAYVTKEGVLRRIDTVNRLLMLTDRTEINLDDIVAIEQKAGRNC